MKSVPLGKLAVKPLNSGDVPLLGSWGALAARPTPQNSLCSPVIVGPLGGSGCEALQGKELAFPWFPEIKFGLAWARARQKMAQFPSLMLRPSAQRQN